MVHLPPAHHKTSKCDSPHETKIKVVEPSKYLRFEFKHRHVNDSSQSNQKIDHLISHYPLGLEVEKSTHARIIAFYVMGMSTKNLRISVFVDSTNSIIEKMRVMMRTATEEKAGLKRWFDTFLSFLV
jgi:hypothetical protein